MPLGAAIGGCGGETSFLTISQLLDGGSGVGVFTTTGGLNLGVLIRLSIRLSVYCM